MKTESDTTTDTLISMVWDLVLDWEDAKPGYESRKTAERIDRALKKIIEGKPDAKN